jgi:ABC-2 type transport system permease protein
MGGRVRAMTRKEFRQLWRDRRTLALLVFQPLVLLLVFGYAARFDVTSVRTVVAGPGAEQAVAQLPDVLEVVDVRPGDDRADVVADLQAGTAGVGIVTGSGAPTALVDGSELFAARSVVPVLERSPAQVEVLFNPDLDTPPVMVPALAGLILAFVGTIATSLGVVRERAAGTLEQLAVMPLRPSDVLGGKVVPYLLVALVDLVLVMGVSVLVFDVPFNGSVWLFGIGSLLFLIVTLSLGLLVSSVSENQGQAMQLALMVTLPQVLLSGAIFPVESMAIGIRWIAYVLPLTWFVEVARGVMLRGAGAADLVLPLVVLAVMAVAVFTLGVLRVRRDLAPSGRGAPAPAHEAVPA